MVEAHFSASMNYDQLPTADLQHAMARYVEKGIRPDHFLTAVLENNLRESFARADHVSLAHMHRIITWFYNELPGALWGSPAVVEAHMKSFILICAKCGDEVHADQVENGTCLACLPDEKES